MKAAIALFLALAFSALAQRGPADLAHPYVEAVGEVSISAKPDQAKIDLGVTTQGQTAGAAAAQNAKQVDAVLGELRKLLGPAAEIKTTRYSINPSYNYPKPGSQPTITGYTANNIVEVTLSDVQQVGKVLDTATQAGANDVPGIDFTLKNDQPIRAQALREAATRARANAEAMASGLGVRLGKVLSVEQNSSVTIPPRPRAMALNASAITPIAPTPIEAGNIDVRGAVTIRVEALQ